MELLLTASSNPSEDGWNWDIDIDNGLPATVPAGAEEDQEAAVIAYLQTSTIPLMEDKGVNWTGYLGKKLSLAEIDSQIRENIKTYLDSVNYSPTYSTNKGKLDVSLAKVVINTGV